MTARGAAPPRRRRARRLELCRRLGRENDQVVSYSAPGVIGAGLLIAAIALLFAARYPAGLYDLVVGINRWSNRLVVYLALMTDRYPPLPLDQGNYDPEGSS